MRNITSAIALLALLGVSVETASAQSVVAKPIAPLACHIDRSTGIGECLPVDALAKNADQIMGLVLPDAAAAQHDAHVQDWQRQQITDRAKAAYIAGGSAK